MRRRRLTGTDRGLCCLLCYPFRTKLLHRPSAFLKGPQGSTVLWCHVLALLPVYPVSETIAAFKADEGSILVYHPYALRILEDIRIK